MVFRNDVFVWRRIQTPPTLFSFPLSKEIKIRFFQSAWFNLQTKSSWRRERDETRRTLAGLSRVFELRAGIFLFATIPRRESSRLFDLVFGLSLSRRSDARLCSNFLVRNKIRVLFYSPNIYGTRNTRQYAYFVFFCLGITIQNTFAKLQVSLHRFRVSRTRQRNAARQIICNFWSTRV